MKIHFVAIGGSIMHNLALALHQAGHEVTGSDDEIYDPARSRLKARGLLPNLMGWDDSRIHADLDAVVLGMHAKADNPELKKAQDLELKIYSFPEFIYERSKDKRRVVVAGSHGKTTTTSMIMHVLRVMKFDFDYAVGAQLEGFDLMVKLSDAPIIVIEGDEYLSSAVDRRPKFLHYRPDLAIITGIAWDHINVFKTWENYLEQFALFMESMDENAKLIYFDQDQHISKLLELDDVIATPIAYKGYNNHEKDGRDFVIDSKGDLYPIHIFGDHNLQNMHAAQLVCAELGISEPDFLSSMASFGGAKKRMEVKTKGREAVFYNDFAHAPSKVKATTTAVRKKHKSKRIVACVELHSYSSLNKSFIPQYAATLNEADEAIVFYNEHTLEIKRLPPVSVDEIIVAFKHRNIQVFTDPKKLERHLAYQKWDNSVLLMMSSGIFGGVDMDRIAGVIRKY